MHYDNNEVAGYDPGVGGGYEFDNEAYRKLTFDTPPTGDLLTWLQSNAVKQPDGTAVQDTKALTITSNGTVSVTPDAPYDGLSSVDVTVNVSGGSIGEIFRGEVIPTKETPPSELFVTLPNGEQMTITNLWSSNPVTIWDKIVLNGDNVSFLIINATDSHVHTGTQIKHISIDFYTSQKRKTKRAWRRCLGGASNGSIADTLCFKTGSKYVYYWI